MHTHARTLTHEYTHVRTHTPQKKKNIKLDLSGSNFLTWKMMMMVMMMIIITIIENELENLKSTVRTAISFVFLHRYLSKLPSQNGDHGYMQYTWQL